MPETNDLYETLHVDPSADEEVIRAAYRTLAQKYHPDHNKSPEAAEQMKRLNHAYQVLGDPAKRAAYDRQGAGGVPPQDAHHKVYVWRLQLGLLPLVLLIAIVIVLVADRALFRPLLVLVALAAVVWAVVRILKSPSR